ncbi:MAG: type II and III secretion system protein [Sulfuritalea sp.]|nr:type II and III secretion system protein [Sulfuritalea sp.]
MKRLLWVLLLGCSLAWGQTLEIIHLKHRNADAVLPQLMPFLEPGGALSGMNDTIFLRASSRNKAEIRALLNTLDTPVRRLMISVRQDGSSSDEGRGAGVSGRVEIGGGAPVISGRGHLYQSDRSSRRDTQQQVQTIDGGRAAIMVGQSFLVPMRQMVLTPSGAVISEQFIQRDLGTGFVAVPRLNGDRVTIEISPRDDTPGPLPGSVNVQRLHTTVSGRLGEWLELGGLVREQSSNSGEITSYRAGSASRQRRLLLKVEALP